MRERGTLERLAGAGAQGHAVSRSGADTLTEAFRFLQRLRLGQQLEDRRGGRPVGNRLATDRLSPLERRHLKDAFLAIREMQDAVAQRYGTDLLG